MECCLYQVEGVAPQKASFLGVAVSEGVSSSAILSQVVQGQGIVVLAQFRLELRCVARLERALNWFHFFFNAIGQLNSPARESQQHVSIQQE